MAVDPIPGYKWTPETHAAMLAGMPGSGINRLTQLAMGNDRLVTNPGLLDALHQNNATPEQAQAINNFMMGLELEKQVHLTRAAGHQMMFTGKQQTVLDQMGVNYSDIQQTQQQADNTLGSKLAAQGLAISRDQNGNVITDPATGQPLLKPANKPEKKHGWSFGRILSDVGEGLSKSWNAASSSAISVSNDIRDATGLNNMAGGSMVATPRDSTEEEKRHARDAGYDPDSLFSMIAYDASGKSKLPLTHLATQWDLSSNGSGITGQQALDQAIQFTTNPADYRQKIENDPTMNNAQKAERIHFLSSDAFVNLVKQVAGNTATVGNVIAQSVGLDPVKDPLAYKVTSAGTDFAAAIMADPLILFGKVYKAERAAQVGIKNIDGQVSPDKIRALFVPLDAEGKATNLHVAGLQRRWTDYLSQTAVLADDGASTVEKARAYQKIQSSYPELAPMTEHFTGANQLAVDAEGHLISNGKNGFLTTSGPAIKSLEDAGDYLASKMVLVTTAQGKAALETSLMPGATSLFGFRALKGTFAEWLAGGTEKINLNRLTKSTSILPATDNAIDADGRVIAAKSSLADAQAALEGMKGTNASFAEGMKAFRDRKAATTALAEAETTAAKEALDNVGSLSAGGVGDSLTGHLDAARLAIESGVGGREALASARRAAFEDPVLRGQIQQNMVRRGTINGEGFNLFGMIAARNELVTRRLSSLLPRNTFIGLTESASQDKIYRYSLLYMNKGDAALTAARWAGGDEATRRALISAMQLQTAHSAGFGYTDSGRAALAKIEGLLDNKADTFGGVKPDTQLFSGVHELDVVADPQLGGQEAHYAVHFDQAIDSWTLPNFAQLQKDANRFGIWDRVLGRAFTSQIADGMMHGFKMIQLAKPSTYTRNALEGWANAVFRGDAAGGIRAKALGVAIEHKVKEELTAKAGREGWTKTQLDAEIERLSPLQKKGWLTSHIPHLVMGQWYRSAIDGGMLGADAEGQYILKLLDKPGEAKQMMQGYGLQHFMSDIDPTGIRSKAANFEAGLGSSQLTFGANTSKHVEGWAHAATDGFEGAQKYSRALGIRYASDPEYTNLLLDAAKAGDGDISAIVDAIDRSPLLQKKVGNMRFSSVFKDKDGQWVQAVTEADKRTALEQLVRKQVEDTRYMLTDKSGQWVDNIESELRDGRVPDGAWISKNVKADHRPEAVEAPVFAAAPLREGVNGFFNALYEKVDKAYVRLVEDPIQRTTSMPLFLHNYGKARVGFSAMEEKLVSEHGFTPEVADRIMQEAAMKSAWVKTESIIDDPGLKSQFDIVGRNFMAYSRATQAMIRRWGQAGIQDPARILKANLAYEAAEHSGAIWYDEQGQAQFSFPASGALINLLTGAMNHVPILGGFMQVPTVPDLTGRVMLSVPGLENPLHMSTTPLVNVPFRAVERLFPDHLGVFSEIDRTVNGSFGNGQIGSQFEPTALQKFITVFSTDDRNGMVASATVGALVNLIAGGHIPAPDASPDEQQRFIDNTRTTVRNHLFFRAVLGLWSPTPPSVPAENTPESQPADFPFQFTGIHNLASEFKQMLNDMGGDYPAAIQLWTALHPDKLVYTQSKSGSLANKAYLPDTVDALKWTEDNIQFINKYKSVAGYFLPEKPGAFNSTAYSTQLAIGLRERKTPAEFLNTAMVNIVRPEYKLATAAYDQKIASATAANDPQAVKSLKAARAVYVKDFNARNPLWKANNVNYSVKALSADSAIRELKEMVKDPSTPKSVPVQVIDEMLQSWDKYQEWKNNNPSSTNQQKDARTMMASAFSSFMEKKAQQVPGLIDLYQGVFRQLDNKLVDLNADN